MQITLYCYDKISTLEVHSDNYMLFRKDFWSGAPSDCFRLHVNICSENQIFPRVFYYLRTAKKF